MLWTYKKNSPVIIIIIFGHCLVWKWTPAITDLLETFALQNISATNPNQRVFGWFGLTGRRFGIFSRGRGATHRCVPKVFMIWGIFLLLVVEKFSENPRSQKQEWFLIAKQIYNIAAHFVSLSSTWARGVRARWCRRQSTIARFGTFAAGGVMRGDVCSWSKVITIIRVRSDWFTVRVDKALSKNDLEHFIV